MNLLLQLPDEEGFHAGPFPVSDVDTPDCDTVANAVDVTVTQSAGRRVVALSVEWVTKLAPVAPRDGDVLYLANHFRKGRK